MSWVKRRWYDFRTGHSLYTGFFFGLVNFVLIVYNFLLSKWFDNVAVFALLVLICYVPVATVLGLFHRRFQLKTDLAAQAEMNPIYFEFKKELEEIKELLKK